MHDSRGPQQGTSAACWPGTALAARSRQGMVALGRRSSQALSSAQGCRSACTGVCSYALARTTTGYQPYLSAARTLKTGTLLNEGCTCTKSYVTLRAGVRSSHIAVHCKVYLPSNCRLP